MTGPEKPTDAAPTAPAPPRDDLVTTRHTLRTEDDELAYTVRTGRIVVGEEEVKDGVFGGTQPRAQMAVTAYTLDDADATQRPITFVFNGGPGAASLWLHLGVLGPRLVDVGEVDALTPPPYGLVDNPHTLLRESDLLFIDPMSTGHTRPVEGGKAEEFHGFGKDVEQVSEVIRLWCTREGRWLSPKFLCGESYGTTRAVAVAHRLAKRHAMTLNGLVLVSSVLDFGSQDFEIKRWDESCIGFLPTYAAIAWYHGLVGEVSLADHLAAAEEFANGPYRLALGRGNDLPGAEREEVAGRLAALTGLSADYVLACDLRVEHWRFCGELLRERGLNVGRLDGRFTGPKDRLYAENMDADPSIDVTSGPFTAAMHHYLHAELGARMEHSYETFASAISSWSFKEFEAKPIDVTDLLERVLRQNPFLQVRLEYGFYDLATPYSAQKEMLRHLRITPQMRERFEISEFETGHMPYLHGPSRVREADEICAFVKRASNR